MRPIIFKCPSCQGDLVVSQLNCPSCAIAIDGEFAPPALLRLTPAQLDFVEVFLKNRGIIRDVERELGISYPTVRARLDEVVVALGFQGRSSGSESTKSSRRQVLEDLKVGRITPEQALEALGRGPKSHD